MGDMGMANTYKRLGEQKFTNRQPILLDQGYGRVHREPLLVLRHRYRYLDLTAVSEPYEVLGYK